MIEELSSQGHSVKECCHLFKVSQSGYYAARKNTPTERQNHYLSLEQQVLKMFFLHKGRYGRIRLKKELEKAGINLSEKFIAKVLKENRLRARGNRSFRPKTTTQGEGSIASNHLKTKEINAPNQVLVTDITYIPTKEGFLYLSALMDLYSRKIKGYSLGESLHTQLTLESLEDALKKHPELIGSLHHSDRGCQYTSYAYAEYLKKYELKPSMSATGYCYDNAAMESFWATLKREAGEIYTPVFGSKEEARQAIFEYIDGYYNTVRMHSMVDYQSPDEIEKNEAV